MCGRLMRHITRIVKEIIPKLLSKTSVEQWVSLLEKTSTWYELKQVQTGTDDREEVRVLLRSDVYSFLA